MLSLLGLSDDALSDMDRELVRLTRGYARERLRLGSVLHRLGRGFREHGFRTLAMYVRERASQNARFCSESRALARRLEELPRIREALCGGAIGWSLAHELARCATAQDEAALLDAVREMSVRQVRAALREAGQSSAVDEEEEESELDPFVSTDLSLEHREQVLALESARMGIELLNGGEGEPGEWLECLVAEGLSSLMEHADLELPDVRARIASARESRARSQEALDHAERQARPRAAPVLEPVGGFALDEDLDGCDAVALDAKVVEVSARLASRDLWLGRSLSRFLLLRGWERLGYASEQHYFDERLGIARSTARGRVTLARRAEWLEGLDAALQDGTVGYEQASLISRVANPETLGAWIARAKARTFKHLREEVRAADLLARAVGRGPVDVAPPTDEELAAVFDFERKVLSGELMADAVSPGASRTDVVQMSVSQDPNADAARTGAARAGVVQMSVGRRLGASYPVRARESALIELRALEALYRASGRPGTFLMYCVASFWRHWGAGFRVGNRWKVEVHDRDRHRCCSPVCDSRVCTNHHVRYRSHGGGDEAENQITSCDFCHLEGEHGGRLKVRGTAPELMWVLGRTPILRVEGRTKIAA